MVSRDVVMQAWDVRKRYRAGDPLAVDGVSLSIAAGQALGLLGPNGAGKSTMVRIIAGLLRPDGGRIRLFGSSPGDVEARRLLGYVPEDPDFPRYLRAGDVLDYFGRLLGLPAADRARRIPEALDWACLAGETRQVRHFSKGMKQRLGLAQAIIGGPRLLVLDEPTADLDPVGRHDVRELIASFKSQGTSVLLNSHLLGEVERVCDVVAIMVEGRILREGPIGEVVPADRTLEEVFMELVRAGSGPGHGSIPSFRRPAPGEAS